VERDTSRLHHVDADGALRQAAESDRRRREGGALGPLDGVIEAVKDVIDVAGMPTSAGSRVREGRGPEERDAPCVARLRSGGAILIGKTHTQEFALGGTGENSFLGHARNPHDPDRITGGSSSGSAIAVATGMAHAALGTDAGGSVRGPATLYGVTGFKPTYGSIDLAGVLPSGWSLDALGVLAPGAGDIPTLFSALTGVPDRWDSPASAVRVGIPGRYFAECLS
jgi:Asp-tRNA(Asn)/Glu-tRNA(Gln) amidotransferase A subunit family amidase